MEVTQPGEVIIPTRTSKGVYEDGDVKHDLRGTKVDKEVQLRRGTKDLEVLKIPYLVSIVRKGVRLKTGYEDHNVRETLKKDLRPRRGEKGYNGLQRREVDKGV